MSDNYHVDCPQEKEIDSIKRVLGELTTNVALMTQSNRDLAEFTRQTSVDVREMVNTLNNYVVLSTRLTGQVERNTTDINNLGGIVREQNFQITDIKIKIGEYSLKELSDTQAVHEDFLKGAKWIGGGVILAIVGLILTAIAGVL